MEKNKLELLVSKMEFGDREILAKKAKCSIKTVDFALRAKRNGKKSKAVIKALVELIEKREKEKLDLEKRVDRIINIPRP